MLPMEVKDDSKYLLCPMPGTLISLGLSFHIFVYTNRQKYMYKKTLYMFLYVYMPMEVEDDSKYLLCPMPRTLISLGVSFHFFFFKINCVKLQIIRKQHKKH
jgi:hypothetical protein